MIDEDALMQLDEESIKDMVIAVGPRKTFLQKFNEEKVNK